MLLFVATDVCKIDSRIMEEEGRSHLEDNSNWSYTESPDDAWQASIIAGGSFTSSDIFILLRSYTEQGHL